MKLEDKVVLVTGGAQGQGRAHAARCAAEGATVVVTDIDAELGQKAVQDLTEAGHTAVFHTLDVADSANWDEVISRVVEQFGRLDALVNNAGIASANDVRNATDEEWTRTLSINQSGVFFGIRAAAAAIAESGGGAIVNVSSTLGFFASPVGFAYQATKGAIRMMTKSAALSLAKDGIRVNTVLPGLVDTPFLDDLKKVGGLADSTKRIALGRLAQAEDIANAVVFLLSSEASYITGSELVVDGGLTAGSIGSLQSVSE